MKNINFLDKVEYSVQQANKMYMPQVKDWLSVLDFSELRKSFCQIIKFVEIAWPAYFTNQDVLLCSYFESKSVIFIQNGLLVPNDCTVISRCERFEILKAIH